jgi:N-acetylglutamate synthase-like GNAT family acetyltransferase
MNNMRYIKDADVDNTLDRKIRDLLCVCFPEQPVFKFQRHYHEKPQHRWYIEEAGSLVAHTALHCKTIGVNDISVDIGGIAEVAVHPDFRGRKLVRQLLNEAHHWLKDNGYRYSMLFGEKKVYASSGYKQIDANFHYFNPAEESWVDGPIDSAMVALLNECNWPDGKIDLKGPMF